MTYSRQEHETVKDYLLRLAKEVDAGRLVASDALQLYLEAVEKLAPGVFSSGTIEPNGTRTGQS
jgi:hypothetical protein